MTGVFDELQTTMHECFGEPTRKRAIDIVYAPGVPRLQYFDDTKAIIQLGEACQHEELRYIFQLAHELIHTLDPAKLGEASVLEEGAATFFQHWYIRNHVPLTDAERDLWSWPQNSQYKAAHDLISPVLQHDPTALKPLRNAGYTLSLANPSILTAFLPSLSEGAANTLIKRFEDWRSLPLP